MLVTKACLQGQSVVNVAQMLNELQKSSSTRSLPFTLSNSTLDQYCYDSWDIGEICKLLIIIYL